MPVVVIFRNPGQRPFLYRSIICVEIFEFFPSASHLEHQAAAGPPAQFLFAIYGEVLHSRDIHGSVSAVRQHYNPGRRAVFRRISGTSR